MKKTDITKDATMELTFTMQEIALLRNALFSATDALEKESSEDFERLTSFTKMQDEVDPCWQDYYDKSSKKFYQTRALRGSFQDRFREQFDDDESISMYEMIEILDKQEENK